MSFLIERVRRLLGKDNEKALATSVEPESESGWQGSESFKYKEWYSPDGKRRITVTICGGPEYEGTYMKDIYLNAIGEISGGEMMRVQAVAKPNSQETEYNVYLDAITEKEDGWCLTDIAYFSHDNGTMHVPFSWSRPMKRGKYENLSDEEFRELCIREMRAEGIYHMSEILPEIDIKATVVAFKNQIQKLDFSKPILIPKQPSISDNSAPLIETAF